MVANSRHKKRPPERPNLCWISHFVQFWITDFGQLQLVLLWWTRPGSNRRPHRCERCALPTELLAQVISSLILVIRKINIKNHVKTDNEDIFVIYYF